MKKQDVRETLRKGVVINTPHVRIHALLNKTSTREQLPQTAFIVSKKIHPSAVQRHRYQRWMREVLKQHQNLIPKNTMLALVAKPNIKQIDHLNQLESSIISNLPPQGLFRATSSQDKPKFPPETQ